MLFFLSFLWIFVFCDSTKRARAQRARRDVCIAADLMFLVSVRFNFCSISFRGNHEPGKGKHFLEARSLVPSTRGPRMLLLYNAKHYVYRAYTPRDRLGSLVSFPPGHFFCVFFLFPFVPFKKLGAGLVPGLLAFIACRLACVLRVAVFIGAGWVERSTSRPALYHRSN